MCLECQGWTREEVLREHVRLIEEQGWSLTTVELRNGVDDFSYTAGLTRFQGHPEILVSGLQHAVAAQVLNALAKYVQGGRQFRAGEELRSSGPAFGLLRFVRVNDPRKLVTAQEIYGSPLGSVPALQAVWANSRGFLPGQQGWCGEHDGRQQLYGRLKAA